MRKTDASLRHPAQQNSKTLSSKQDVPCFVNASDLRDRAQEKTVTGEHCAQITSMDRRYPVKSMRGMPHMYE